MIKCTDNTMDVHKFSTEIFNEKWSHYNSGSVKLNEDGSDILYDRKRIKFTNSMDSVVGHLSKHASSCDRIYYDGERTMIFPTFLYYAFTGDLFHHPIQIAYPNIQPVSYDFDSYMATLSRKIFLQTIANKDILVFGTHFTIKQLDTLQKRIREFYYRLYITKVVISSLNLLL
ncbi:hypothetical protein CONCODRAFT_9143 [Conidiobolus coronatus NRRL 28638]|uniref:Uncharacterized protein n=1 Tax=Conidiobolus coronatus (strain ATCC 28846 / CBS 209.66 / NRRL 28638) TaxID=796925 RepID=A0A137P101_CONC2|nr:hypothetical protein CONCODRAFT_9143 [Conidiobolus coronatus NRRL 28638]|eukprot:KXN68551.1 hypothetical protein CONCODRAFT_9143 [Conidiobolus coronatus NRRL 28638]